MSNIFIFFLVILSSQLAFLLSKVLELISFLLIMFIILFSLYSHLYYKYIVAMNREMKQFDKELF